MYSKLYVYTSAFLIISLDVEGAPTLLPPTEDTIEELEVPEGPESSPEELRTLSAITSQSKIVSTSVDGAGKVSPSHFLWKFFIG